MYITIIFVIEILCCDFEINEQEILHFYFFCNGILENMKIIENHSIGKNKYKKRY